MVDFAKHAKCIDYTEYEKAEKQVEKYPHYLKGDVDRQRHSNNILGQLWDKVDIKRYYEECTQLEYL